MGEERMASKGGEERVPGRLPIVRVQGSRVKYFFDARLKQLRNVNNPHDFLDLSTNDRDGIEWLVNQGRKTVPVDIP